MAKLPKALNANRPRRDITSRLKAQAAAETSGSGSRAVDDVPNQNPPQARLVGGVNTDE